MDVMKMAAELLSGQLGDNIGGDVEGALAGLLGNGGDGIDIGALVSSLMSQGGLDDIVGSWLGDGANDAISVEQLQQVFDPSALSGFADKLGIDADAALSVLGSVVPDLVDRSSSGGSLLEGIGGVDGVLDLARRLF